MSSGTTAQRPLPQLTPENHAFWTGGERGELMINRCAYCRTWFHPPAPVCPECLSRNVAPEAIPGKATLLSYSVNHQKWMPGLAVPYVIAAARLDSAPDVQLVAELLDYPPERLATGMSLTLCYMPVADIWIPQFRPAELP